MTNQQELYSAATTMNAAEIAPCETHVGQIKTILETGGIEPDVVELFFPEDATARNIFYENLANIVSPVKADQCCNLEIPQLDYNIHLHGEFHGPNKTAVIALAKSEYPEVSELSRVLLWKLLSKHEFSHTDDPVQASIYSEIASIRDELNKSWERHLISYQGINPVLPNNISDENVYSAKSFIQDTQIDERLRAFTRSMDELVLHRRASEAKAVETEGICELKNNVARGAEFATSLVRSNLLSEKESEAWIIEMRKKNQQLRFSLEHLPENTKNLNHEFQEGIKHAITEMLIGEHGNKVDLRKIATSLLSLHGVDLNDYELLNYDFAQLHQSTLEHEDIAVILVTAFIAEIAEEHGIETYLPKATELAAALKEKGFRIVNTHIFYGAHGEGSAAGYHALYNEATGEVDLCSDHAENMDLELQLTNKDINERLNDARPVDYKEGVQNAQGRRTINPVTVQNFFGGPHPQNQLPTSQEDGRQIYYSSINTGPRMTAGLSNNARSIESTNSRINRSRINTNSVSKSSSAFRNSVGASSPRSNSTIGSAINPNRSSRTPISPSYIKRNVSSVNASRETNGDTRVPTTGGSNAQGSKPSRDEDNSGFHTSQNSSKPGFPQIVFGPQGNYTSPVIITPVSSKVSDIVIGRNLETALMSTGTVQTEEQIQRVKKYRDEEHLKNVERTQANSQQAAVSNVVVNNVVNAGQINTRAGRRARAGLTNVKITAKTITQEMRGLGIKPENIAILRGISTALEAPIPGENVEFSVVNARELQQYVNLMLV